MKYEKPELEIKKIEYPNIASSIYDWMDEAETKDTAINSFFVISL